MKKILIAFDIDGTLRSNTVDQSAAPVANERIRSLLIALASFKNTRILVWSGGGELYARQVVASFGLAKYVDEYADKQYTRVENCLGQNSDGVDCIEAGHHHFATDIRPDIAIDDIQSCELGIINLIVREK